MASREVGIVSAWNGRMGRIDPTWRTAGWQPIPFRRADVTEGVPVRGHRCTFTRIERDGETLALAVRVKAP